MMPTRLDANIKMSKETKGLLEFARKLGAGVEIVLVCTIAPHISHASRYGYDEVEDAHLHACEQATILVYDPARAASLFAKTLQPAVDAPITRTVIDEALREALSEYAHRFPGTLP